MSGTVSGLQGIRHELLRWGAQAEVLEPPALRAMMRQEAAAMLATYNKSAPGAVTAEK